MANKTEKLTMRLFEGDREFLELHGHGNASEGFQALISRYRQLCDRVPRNIDDDEAKAICGACNTLMWSPSLRGNSLAIQFEDYAKYEAMEAEQFDVDYIELAEKAKKWTPVEVFAIMNAVEAVFQDHPKGLDMAVTKYFRSYKKFKPPISEAEWESMADDDDISHLNPPNEDDTPEIEERRRDWEDFQE